MSDDDNDSFKRTQTPADIPTTIGILVGTFVLVGICFCCYCCCIQGCQGDDDQVSGKRKRLLAKAMAESNTDVPMYAPPASGAPPPLLFPSDDLQQPPMSMGIVPPGMAPPNTPSMDLPPGSNLPQWPIEMATPMPLSMPPPNTPPPSMTPGISPAGLPDYPFSPMQQTIEPPPFMPPYTPISTPSKFSSANHPQNLGMASPGMIPPMSQPPAMPAAPIRLSQTFTLKKP